MQQQSSGVPLQADGPARVGGSVVAFPSRQAGSSVFTSRDLMELLSWDNDQGCRIAIEQGSVGQEPDRSAFALIYGREDSWAKWGLTRSANLVTLWECATNADLGRFETMREALEAVPCGEAKAEPPAPVASTVVPLRRIAP